MTPWLLVAGDVASGGGMDRANLALARHLAADPAVALHLVSHRVEADLDSVARCHVHRIWRPLGSHALGLPWLSRSARAWARRLQRRGGRVVANGGNCPGGDVNWMHYVHAACPTDARAPGWHGLKDRASGPRHRRDERRAVANARVVVCNSERTRRDVMACLRVPEARTRVVYYGVDGHRFRLTTDAERVAARAGLGLQAVGPIVSFVGALGDRRKGFDLLFDAWGRLCQDPRWDAHLVVTGRGASVREWQRRTRELGIGHRVRFLGFRSDVERVLAASDALAHPARYEAYGLAVHEAICRGLPALVTASAGIAERYPPALADLLLPEPVSPPDLAARLWLWRRSREGLRGLVQPFAARLRGRSWTDMAREVVEVAEAPE